MGNMLLAATSSSKSGGGLQLILLLVVIFGIFYFLMIRPQRNRQRRTVQVQDAVVPGQRVRTTAGMYGTVTAVEDGDVVIEVAPGVEVRYLKRAIMDVLSDAPDADSDDGVDYGADYGVDAEEPADEPAADAADDADADHAEEADPAQDGQAPAQDGQAAEK